MLYKYDKNGKKIEMQKFFNYEELGGLEKDLEDLMAENLGELYGEAGQLMPIFQERPGQGEPDLCALDKYGNLFIFELKRSSAGEDTTIQVMRYTQNYGRKNYRELNATYNKYLEYLKQRRKDELKTEETELKVAHAEAFGLEKPLAEEEFNRRQKMIVVGSSAERGLMDAVDYWKSTGLDIDFIPYRFFKIGKELFFEFFAKPYDYHLNPREKKGILFDTNRRYGKDDIWDMLKNSKVSAYGDAAGCVDRFRKNDYVLYYHVGMGVVAAGIITDGEANPNEAKNEKFRKVKLLTPVVESEEELKSISASELGRMLDKTFCYVRTVKTPYLSAKEAELVIEELKRRYGME